jgi:uncharacterized protein YndB with AHSA1/START domain
MTDVQQQINAVSRRVGTRTLEAGEARVSTIGRVYDTGPDDLWDAVTDPDRIARWFLPVTGDLKEGGRYQLQGNAGGTITRCDAPHGYAATWEMGDTVSWIEVRLSPAGPDRTRFELEHVAHVDDELWDRYGPGATGLGWDMGLVGLSWHVADPAVTPDPAAIQAWLTSDEGRAMLRGSADAWAGAEIAAGGDPAAARRHADTSYAAYTGEG